MLHQQNNLKKFESVEFLAKQFVEGFITGLHKSPFHGFSVEFAEHRLYNVGESTRHIDWKVFAKTDKLFVKRFEEETNLRCNILLDVSSSMFYPQNGVNKLKFSCLAAACLVIMLQKQRDAVGLHVFDEIIKLQTPIKSSGTHVHQILTHLQSCHDAVSDQKKTNVVETLHQLAENMHRRSLVIIFSDMFDNIDQADQLFSALQHLKHNKHEVLLFHVTEPKTERDFEFEQRPHLFIDLETGQKLEVLPSEVKESYQASIHQFYKEFKLKCLQYKIDFIDADISKGFDDILTQYLIKRQKMR